MLISNSYGETNKKIESHSGNNQIQLHMLATDNKDMQIAGHSSHASHGSHASHSSHFSSAGSGSRPSGRSIIPAPNNNTQPMNQEGKIKSLPETNGPNTSVLKLTEKVQIKLAAMGIYKGKIDGVLNKETIEAIKDYQYINNINASGKIDAVLLRLLAIN